MVLWCHVMRSWCQSEGPRIAMFLTMSRRGCHPLCPASPPASAWGRASWRARGGAPGHSCAGSSVSADPDPGAQIAAHNSQTSVGAQCRRGPAIYSLPWCAGSGPGGRSSASWPGAAAAPCPARGRSADTWRPPAAPRAGAGAGPAAAARPTLSASPGTWRDQPRPRQPQLTILLTLPLTSHQAPASSCGALLGPQHTAAAGHPPVSPPATLAAFIKTECLSSSRAEPHSASHRGIAMIKQQGSHSALPGLCCQARLARAPSLPLLSELICCCWHQAPRQPWPRPGRRQLCTRHQCTEDQHTLPLSH